MVQDRQERIVTVFGSGKVAEGSAEYGDAYRLGILLAGKGYTVANGGYDGAMAAVSRGARDGGGRAIGMTVDLFPGKAGNGWLVEEVRTASLFGRLEALTERADAFIALPGGIGTLLEIALVWNLALISKTFRKPIILVGGSWDLLVTYARENLIIGPNDCGLVHPVADIDGAIDLLETLLVAAAG